MIAFEVHRSDKIEYLYQQINLNMNFQKHAHRSFELVFVFEGQLECEVEEEEYMLEENAGLLILPGQIHSYRTRNFSRSYLCVFSNDWVQEFYEEIKGKRFRQPVFARNDRRFFQVLQNEQSNKFLIKSVLYEICGNVYSEGGLVETKEGESALMNALVFYIQEHYQSNISLKGIAKELGYNYSYLSSFFNQHFGMNFSAYVNGYRIQYAREYLAKTNMEITEIALLCGFESIRNFNRTFKQEVGMTPGGYRKAQKIAWDTGSRPADVVS